MVLFQSTPPMRVATTSRRVDRMRPQISIHATHAGGDSRKSKSVLYIMISIHATHAGGDFASMTCSLLSLDFNPRHPCGWRQFCEPFYYGNRTISIHATHAGGDINHCVSPFFHWISIHATHAGGDYIGLHFQYFHKIFQSTPPMRVATK